MIRRFARFAVALALVTPFIASAAEIAISDPYARAVPPGQPNSAVFLSLRNLSTENRALVGAASPVAEVVELHTHTAEDGVMRMRRIERIDVPAGETVKLQPGGLHVMLIGLKQSLEPDSAVDLTLQYDDGTTATIQAPVRRIQAPSMPHSH